MKDHLSIAIAHGCREISQQEWNLCAAPSNGVGGNPFLTSQFITALEESGAASPSTGWSAHHLVARRGGEIIAIMPVYLKNHSYGEYIFDWQWAEALEKAGGRYYPKFQSCIPFTPVTGHRILLRQTDHDTAAAMVQTALAIASDNHISSMHWTFIPKSEQELLSRFGALARSDHQFHWKNRGYHDFDDFLGQLQSRKRKEIRRERKILHEQNISLTIFHGTEITKEIWDRFYLFYQHTCARKWGRAYLNRRFFAMIGETMQDQIILVMCKRDGQWIAGALHFIGGDKLYGRYWGAVEHHPCLHFEACYYQAIEQAIALGLSGVEAGAQGAHKIARGYEPVSVFSAHWIAMPAFRDAIADYLLYEHKTVNREIKILDQNTPFRKNL